MKLKKIKKAIQMIFEIEFGENVINLYEKERKTIKKATLSCQKGLGKSRENPSKSCKKILTQM